VSNCAVTQKVCEKVKQFVDTNDVSSLFYATSVVNVLKAAKTNCEVSLINVVIFSKWQVFICKTLSFIAVSFRIILFV